MTKGEWQLTMRGQRIEEGAKIPALKITDKDRRCKNVGWQNIVGMPDVNLSVGKTTLGCPV
jgi:hypothetical protein